MPGQYLILRSVTLLLLAAVMTIIAGISSAQRREARGRDASIPQDTIVIDSIGDLPTNTRFKLPGSSGSPLDVHNSVGPEFTLTKATTITEIGAYVESCICLVRGKYLEPCEPFPTISVDIHPQLNGKPDLATVIASYNLSNDNDRTLTSYESVKIELTLEPGTYYAIFNNTYKYGMLMCGASDPHEYMCKSVTMAYVRKDPDEVVRSRQYLAVRILKN